LNAGLRLQLVYAYKTNDITKNIPIEEVSDIIKKLVDNAFKKVKLTSNESTYVLTFFKSVSNGKLTVTVNEKVEEVSMNHDRKKNVPVDTDAAFLRALKVTQEGGRPYVGIYMYVCMYIHIYIYIYTYIYIYMYIFAAFLRALKGTQEGGRPYVGIYIYICIYVCMHVCIHILYIHMHI
jgi:hypothetical protein